MLDGPRRSDVYRDGPVVTHRRSRWRSVPEEVHYSQVQRDSPSTIGERTRVICIIPPSGFVQIRILEFSGIYLGRYARRGRIG